MIALWWTRKPSSCSCHWGMIGPVCWDCNMVREQKGTQVGPMSQTDDPKPGELCKPCREARAVEHYHNIKAVYCQRCKSLQERALLAERETVTRKLVEAEKALERAEHEAKQARELRDGWAAALADLK